MAQDPPQKDLRLVGTSGRMDPVEGALEQNDLPHARVDQILPHGEEIPSPGVVRDGQGL